ncbi:unnamed protein product [Porites lobata]|nr:unnamed protein product [Porites lobata]
MHPILILFFAFKEEGKAIEKRRKSNQCWVSGRAPDGRIQHYMLKIRS